MNYSSNPIWMSFIAKLSKLKKNKFANSSLKKSTTEIFSIFKINIRKGELHIKFAVTTGGEGPLIPFDESYKVLAILGRTKSENEISYLFSCKGNNGHTNIKIKIKS